jgi:trans-aconitate 2-methyltransferase
VNYTFGDSELARERLALVADTFAGPTRAFLRVLPEGTRRYVIDLGCGPGFTTELLHETFPHGYVTGLDASAAMVDDARRRFGAPNVFFVEADITVPLTLPAHLVFGRLLLGHLPDPNGALANWSAALLPAGVLACEEPVRYRSDIEVFNAYEEAVTAVVAAQGATLWAGDALDAALPGCVRLIDRVVEHPVPAARAAAMFWRNAVNWNGEPDLIEELRGLEESRSGDVVMWELRQTAWVKGQ